MPATARRAPQAHASQLTFPRSMAPAALARGVGRAMEVTSVTSAAVLVDFAGRQAIIALQDGRWSAMNLHNRS
jgi:hypothetical protein